MRHIVLTVLLVLLLAACGTAQPSVPTPVPVEPTAEVVEQATATTAVVPTEAEPTATEMAEATATEAVEPTATEAEATATVEPEATETEEAAPTEAAEGGELVIFAAASLTEAFEELGAAFEAANPGTTVVFNFAGSQQLAQQIGQGAPVDVFASANQSQMNVVVETGDVVTGTQQVFVRNRLVVVHPSDNPAGLESLQDLATPGVRLVLAAAEVPVGEYSLAFFDKASADPTYGESFREGAIANVVSYEENVRAVLSKVTLGEADAGIVYTSDVSADSTEVGQIPIPDELNTIASYPIAPIAGSEQEENAQRFIEYVLSEEGQEVLARYGFIPAAEGG